MATITANIQDETAERFRATAYAAYGRKKGSLGKAIDEALNEWSAKQKYIEACMNLLKTGVSMGKLRYKKREELHERG